VGAALNDAGLAGGASPTGRPVAEFISENPQDSEISRDSLSFHGPSLGRTFLSFIHRKRAAHGCANVAEAMDGRERPPGGAEGFRQIKDKNALDTSGHDD